MNIRLLIACALALSVSACATLQQYEAANDIRALLISIRDTDQAAFDAHVDKPALKAQLRAVATAEALKRKDQLGALGAVLAGPLVDIIVDRYLRPEVFLAVAEADGYSPDRPIPNAALLTPLIRPLDAEHACVTTKQGGPCAFLFRKEASVWKLVAFQGDPRTLKLNLRL